MADEPGNGMIVDWDVAIAMGDGVVLRADVFRPADAEPCPAILSYGLYGKGLAFQDGYPDQWEILAGRYPDAVDGSTNRYANWETVDPERFVPHGYACVRVDSRGAGRSPGFLDPWSPGEARDIEACIAWVAAQLWCSGLVGMCGISYYAMNQWRAAALQPPQLAAICVWEGAADFYRDACYHGGIRCVNRRNWFERQVKTVQHGVGERGPRSRVTGELVCGPETLSDEELAANRTDVYANISAHPLDDRWHRALSADWSRVQVPFLSAGAWGGQAMHLRGNVEGFVRAASDRSLARDPRWRALGELLHGPRCRAPAAVLRPVPQGRRGLLARRPTRPAAGSAHRRDVRRPRRGGLADPSDPLDSPLPRQRSGGASGRSRRARARRARRRRRAPRRARGGWRRSSRALPRPSSSSPARPWTPTCSSSCVSTTLVGVRSPFRARTILAPRSARDGCGPRIAGSMRGSRQRLVPTTGTTG